jgi:4-hydroxyproline epimerase
LYADGKLQAGQKWRQESIIGSLFEASITIENGQVLPSITGSAFVNGEGYLVLDERDPFCYGIPVPGSAQEMVTSH